MGRQALLVVLCWLKFSESLGEAEQTTQSLVIKDNVSEESAPRLYGNVPVGVYASAVPYPAVSYRFPAFASGLLPAASRVIPVKEEVVLHNSNAFLKDSYGNRFVGSPYSASYRAAIPQQFVQLQELPAHLTKPLTVAAPNYQFKPFGTQFTLGTPFRIPTVQAASPTPLSRFSGSSHPVVYAQNIRSLAPPAPQSQPQQQQLQSPQQQSSSNQAVYADTHSAQKYGNYQSEPKFQRLEEKPFTTYGNVPVANTNNVKQEIIHEQSQIKASPDTQTYTTIVNGKKTVVQIDTNPPIPLLDLTLLEPLTFDNPSPVVPQIAQYLPKINQATYKKLPEFHKQKKNNSGHKIQGDVEVIKGRPKAKPKKKSKKPNVHEIDNTHTKVPVEPTYEANPNEGPELSYEINKPNYRETYKEKTVKYNKETKKDPVSYSYDHKEEKDPVSYSYGNIVQKEPVVYSIVHNSKNPGDFKQVQHQINEQPKQLIYNFKPEEQKESEESSDGPPQSPPQRESDESSSAEVSDDDRPPHPPSQYHENNRESSREQNHHEYHEQPRPVHHEVQYYQRPLEVEHRQRPQEEYHSERHAQKPHYDQRPHHVQQSSHEHERPSHRNQQPIKVPVIYQEELRPITHEYEEDIKLLPNPNSAAIKVDPNQHIQREGQNPHPSAHPYTSNDSNEDFVSQQPRQNHQTHQESYGPQQGPIVREKSKHIIIQEESPNEMHSHREKMVAEMLEREENNEEDFEKAYKNAAFGFPAFHKKPEDIEKDIYSPDSYGESHNEGFSFDHRPFEQYQAQGDEFPKSARLTYKDANENNKEDYFLDYAVNKPTSLRDRHKKKQEYFKLYDSYKPEKYFGGENKQKEKEKYIVSPSYVYVTDPEPKKTSFFARYKAAPPKFTYTFKKQNPRDSSAFSSRPYQSYTRKTNFVEPQFQYGFEPIALPRLLDSELSAMASNDSPESEKPALRKKVYKENWYIKKTRTAGGDAS